MTSSLVGSEMCIRDSMAVSEIHEQDGMLDPELLEALDAELNNANFPVSYTHLTLPTICSV
eukprot:6341644-Prorocentrum_lima.AAC.1